MTLGHEFAVSCCIFSPGFLHFLCIKKWGNNPQTLQGEQGRCHPCAWGIGWLWGPPASLKSKGGIFPPSLLIYRRKGSFLWPFGAFKGRTFQLFSFLGLWLGGWKLLAALSPTPRGSLSLCPCPSCCPAHLPGELQEFGGFLGGFGGMILHPVSLLFG